ncbi:hypothetical protein AB4059_06830 [Lysobacter sp. 2RAF19]
MATSSRSFKWSRSLLAGLFIVALLSVASAQSVAPRLVQVDAITQTVIGRAPVVTVAVENTTRPGEAPIVGDALRATASTTDPDGDTITATSYRWLRAGTEIASTNTYTVVEADRGLTLSVEAIATTDSAITDPASGTGSTSTAIANNTAPRATPTITGTVAVGTQLTGHPGYSDAEGDPEGTHLYQWYRSDNASGTPRTPIANATSATYTPFTIDQTKYLVLGVIPVSTVAPTTGEEAFVVSAVVPGTAPNIINVTVSGDWRVGGVIEGTFNLVDAEGDQIDEANMQYQWMVSSSPTGGGPVLVPGANGRTFTLRAEDIGSNRRVWFSVEKAATLTGVPKERLRPTNPAGQWQASRQGVIEGHAPTMTEPLINGTVAVGQTLTAVPQGYDDLDGDAQGTHLYAWFHVDNAAGANPVAISGATTSTHVVAATDQAKFLMVRITPVSATGTPNTGNAVSKVTAIAVPGTAPTVTNVRITGTFEAGQFVTGEYDVNDAEGDLEDRSAGEYMWFINDTFGFPVHIPGETSRTYRLRAGDEGNRTLWFRVTKIKTLTGTPNEATRPGSPNTAWQVEQRVTINGRAPTMTAPLINGTVGVGRTLTAVPQGYEDLDLDAEGTHLYQWFQVDNTAGDNPVQIATATSATFIVRVADKGKFLMVRITPVSATGSPNTGPAVTTVTATAVPTGNVAPTATQLSISGAVDRDQTLEAIWTYADAENDAQGTHSYQWYVADDVLGTVNKTAIPGATSKTYVVAAAYQGKHIGFSVTPRDVNGGVGDIETIFSDKEARYRVTGTFNVNGVGVTQIPLTISNRSGNGPANLRVGVWRSNFFRNGKQTYRVNCTLNAPDGTRFTILCPLYGSAEMTTIDASGVPVNGVWRLDADMSQDGQNVKQAEITHFTLEFTP